MGFLLLRVGRRRRAENCPDSTFAIVDDAANEADNVANLVFAEEQGSFLVGAAAALTTQSDHVGFIGGVNIELIHKFEAGFAAGVAAVDPAITVDVEYLTEPPDFDGFNDPDLGREVADQHVRGRRRRHLRRGRWFRRWRVRGRRGRP